MLLSLAKQTNKKKIVFLGFLQITLVFSILNLPDIFHLLLNSFPLIILIGFIVEKKLNIVKKAYLIRYIFLAGVSIIYLSIIIRFSINQQLSQKTEEFLSLLQAQVKDEKIFITPFMPGIYFELGKPNPFLIVVKGGVELPL